MLNIFFMEGCQDHPEELSVNPSAALPLIREILEDSGDPDSIIPDVGHRQLRSDRNLDVPAVSLV